MSGKRQHYIPQFLQRGFLAADALPAERTWLHRRGTSPRLVGIRDVGVEDWFYSRRSTDGLATLDDTITALEQEFGKEISILRRSSPGTSVDAEHTARTVIHLVMRTAHLRRLMSNSIDTILDELKSLFSNPARLGAMLGANGLAMAPIVTDGIRKCAEEMVADGIPGAFSERIITFLIREFGEHLVEEATTSLGPFIPILLATFDSSTIVRDQHNSILSGMPESAGWVTELAKFKWTVELAENLILPDAVALARELDGTLTALLFSKSANVSAVLMPIASDRMLIGKRERSAMISLSDFNGLAAANSESFFISASRSTDEGIVGRIGSAPSAMIKNAIEAAVYHAERARTRRRPFSKVIRDQKILSKDFDFSIALIDFGDEIVVEEFKNILEGVVGQLARDMPLHDLDGFSLARDYVATIASLDRGDPELPPVTTRALDYAVGAIMPVTVNRNGNEKEHLVVASWLAESWLSTDAEISAAGLHTLVNALAGVAHSTLYSEAARTNFRPDTIGREFHLSVAQTPVDYWCARKSAFISPDQGQRYADLVIEGLEFAETVLANERARTTNGNIDDLMTEVLRALAAVASHAAGWLGHRDGLTDGQEFAGSNLPERLGDRGLARWVELFGRDLAACYRDDAIDLEVLTGLSSHIERLCWSIGIYCWPDKDKARCLVTDQGFRPPPL